MATNSVLNASVTVTDIAENGFSLKWERNRDLNYEVFVKKSLVSGEDWKRYLNKKNVGSLNIRGLESGTQYVFYVQASDDSGNVIWKSGSNVKTKYAVTEQPGRLPVTITDVAENGFSLKWMRNRDLNYEVFVKSLVSGEDWKRYLNRKNVGSLNIRGLQSGTLYAFYVQASFDSGKVILKSEEGRLKTKEQEETVAVTDVRLYPSSISLFSGKTQQLSVQISPSNATNMGVVWSSSNPSCANVTATGLVRGLNRGHANITVLTKDGGKTAVVPVAVYSLVLRVSLADGVPGDHYANVPSVVRPYGDNGKWRVLNQRIGLYLFKNDGSMKSGMLVDEKFIQCSISNPSVVSVSYGSMYVIGDNGKAANATAVLISLRRRGSSTVRIAIKDPMGSESVVYQTEFTVIVD